MAEIKESKLGIQGWADAGTPHVFIGGGDGRSSNGGGCGGGGRPLNREGSEVSGAGGIADSGRPPKPRAKGKGKAKAKVGGKLKVTDVDRELKSTLPLIDKKLAVENTVKKFEQLSEGDPKFKAWAHTDLHAIQDALENTPAVIEAMIEQVQQLRSSGKNLSKGVLAAYGENSVRELIGCAETISSILAEVDPMIDYIFRMRAEEVRSRKATSIEVPELTPAKKKTRKR